MNKNWEMRSIILFCVRVKSREIRGKRKSNTSNQSHKSNKLTNKLYNPFIFDYINHCKEFLTLPPQNLIFNTV
jgi:hypothetical protein